MFFCHFSSFTRWDGLSHTRMLCMLAVCFKKQWERTKMNPFMSKHYRLSQLLMKQMLVFHSPQRDLPQVANPWVPSASSRPSAVKDGHPSQQSLFSVVLQKQSWTYAIVYKRSSLSRAFPACCLALRKCVWILQGVFFQVIPFLNQWATSLIGFGKQ